MFSLFIKTRILLICTLAFFISISAVMAQTFPTPEEGKTWILSFHDDSLDRNINGIVTFSKGQYQIEIKSVEFNGTIMPSTIPTIVQSEEITSHRRLTFGEPKYETRTTFSDISIIAEANEESDAVVSFSDQVQDFNDYILDPDLKLGTFLDGELLTAAEAEAYSNELRDKMASNPYGNFTNRVFYPLFMKKPEVLEFQKIMSPQSLFQAGVVNTNIPLDFLRTVGSGINFQTVVETKDVNVNIEISRSVISGGVKMRLYRPQTSDGWKTITWDWYIKADGNGKFEARGSLKNGNPIVWGAAPEITDVLVLNDQERITPADYKTSEEKQQGALYPWLDPQAQARVNKNQHSFERELLIVGKNLDQLVGKTPKSQLKSVSYSPISKVDIDEITSRIKKIHESDAIDLDVQREYFSLKNLDDIDILSMRATINSSTNAQTLGFTFKDVEGDWPLLFGTHNGVIRIVRVDVPTQQVFSNTLKSRDGSQSRTTEEIADPIYFRDEILFEVELDHFPEELPVKISLEETAPEDGVGADRAKEIVLEQYGDSGKLFRSKKFLVVDSGADQKTTNSSSAGAEKANDTYSDIPVEKTLALREGQFLRPRLVFTQTSDPLPDAKVRGGNRVVGEFLSALEGAASCYPNAPKVDWENLGAQEEIDFARKTAITVTPGFFPVSKSVDISYGQHASMLMLRRAYIPYMQQPLKLAKSYVDPSKVVSKKMERALEAMWSNRPTPISLFPAGRSSNFHKTVLQFKRGTSFPTIYMPQNGVMQINPALARTIAGRLPIIISQLETSLNTARNTSNCDVEGLLLITGAGFKDIVKNLQESVMRYEYDTRDKITKTRPDMAGRRALETVYINRDIYDAYGSLADAWVTVYKLVGALVSIGASEFAALGLEAAWTAKAAAVLGLGVAGSDLAYTVYDNYSGYQEDRKRLNFARGASVRFGQKYLEQEQAKTTSPLWRVADVGAAGLGAIGDVAKLASNSTAVAQSAQTLRSNLDKVAEFKTQANSILDEANSLLSEYGSNAKKPQLKNFKQIASKAIEKITQDPVGAMANMAPDEISAMKELLGTPSKFLTNKYKDVQKAIRETLETPKSVLIDNLTSRAKDNSGAVGLSDALTAPLPEVPDMLEPVLDYSTNEEVQGLDFGDVDILKEDALNLIPEIDSLFENEALNLKDN